MCFSVAQDQSPRISGVRLPPIPPFPKEPDLICGLTTLFFSLTLFQLEYFRLEHSHLPTITTLPHSTSTPSDPGSTSSTLEEYL